MSQVELVNRIAKALEIYMDGRITFKEFMSDVDTAIAEYRYFNPEA